MQTLHLATELLAAPDWSPNAGTGPGATPAQRFVNWLAFMALVACAVGFLAGVAVGVIGHYAQSSRVQHGGVAAAFIGGAGALLIGAGPAILDWAQKLGEQA